MIHYVYLFRKDKEYFREEDLLPGTISDIEAQGYELVHIDFYETTLADEYEYLFDDDNEDNL